MLQKESRVGFLTRRSIRSHVLQLSEAGSVAPLPATLWVDGTTSPCPSFRPSRAPPQDNFHFDGTSAPRESLGGSRFYRAAHAFQTSVAVFNNPRLHEWDHRRFDR